MSLFIQQNVQSKLPNKFSKTELNLKEEIREIKKKWIGGNSDIKSIINMLKKKDYQTRVLGEEHFMSYSLKVIEKKSLCLFSSDRPMKSFIMSAIEYFNQENFQYPIASWQAKFNDENKLVLVNFGKVPSGNFLFNKYVFTFNYFELEISK